MAKQRRHKGYWIDGKRVPGVTTITGRYKDSGALIHWAWKEGHEGRDYRDTRDKAATAGTVTHDAIENFTRYGLDPVFTDRSIHYVREDDEGHEIVTEVLYEGSDSELIGRVLKSLGAFKEWSAGTKFKVVKSEVELLSQTHRFGGRMDSVLCLGKKGLGDWKTAGGVYPDNLYQLGGYAILWEENFPDDPLEGFHLLRFDKEFGDFHHHFWTDIDEAKRGFLLMRELYEIDKVVKKRAS